MLRFQIYSTCSVISLEQSTIEILGQVRLQNGVGHLFERGWVNYGSPQKSIYQYVFLWKVSKILTLIRGSQKLRLLTF